MNIGERLERARFARGMSRADLARGVAGELRAMGLPGTAEAEGEENAVESRVRGGDLWPMRIVVAWCRVLCLDVGEVVEGVDDWTT